MAYLVFLNTPAISIPKVFIKEMGNPPYFQMWIKEKVIRFVPSYQEGPGNIRIRMGRTGIDVNSPRLKEYYEKTLGWDLGLIYACYPEFEGKTMVLDLERNWMPTMMKPGELGK